MNISQAAVYEVYGIKVCFINLTSSFEIVLRIFFGLQAHNDIINLKLSLATYTSIIMKDLHNNCSFVVRIIYTYVIAYIQLYVCVYRCLAISQVGCFTNLSRAHQNSHALGTRTTSQLTIHSIKVFSGVAYFHEIILESSRNVSETTLRTAFYKEHTVRIHPKCIWCIWFIAIKYIECVHIYRKNIERHTRHTIVSWPNPK